MMRGGGAGGVKIAHTKGFGHFSLRGLRAIRENHLNRYAPMAYNRMMFRFIELTSFSRERDEYFDDDEFALFQRHLASNPRAGDVIAEIEGVHRSCPN